VSAGRGVANRAKRSVVPRTQDFQFIGGTLALDFTNTVGNRLTDMTDYFATEEDVLRWARSSGVPELRSVALLPGALPVIRDVRERLHAVFSALLLAREPRRRTIDEINDLLRWTGNLRALDLRNGRAHWRWDVPLGDPRGVLGPVVDSAADLIVSDRVERLKRCEDHACGWLFVDDSRARRRRWCSMADCGNREKARQHYRRA